MRHAKRGKKGFFRFKSSKRRTREKNGLAAEWDRGPNNKEHREDRGTQCFLCSSLYLEPQVTEFRLNEDDFSVKEDQVREHFNKLDVLRSMDLDGMHPRVLTAKSLLITFERSWQLAEVPEDWKGANLQEK